jgi:hypothetical protein
MLSRSRVPPARTADRQCASDAPNTEPGDGFRAFGHKRAPTHAEIAILPSTLGFIGGPVRTLLPISGREVSHLGNVGLQVSTARG